MDDRPKNQKNFGITDKKINRWSFLKRAGLVTGGFILGGCGISGSGNGTDNGGDGDSDGDGNNDGGGPGPIGDGPILYSHAEDLSYWESLFFHCFQGLVNRNAANIYLTKYQKKIFLDWYKQYPYLQFKEYGDPYDLVMEYASDYADGYVVVDPDAPNTINIGVNYASLEDLLPVTQDLLDSNQLPKLDVKRDLSTSIGGVKVNELNRLQSNQWIYENQWPDASRTLVAIMNRPFYKNGNLQHFYTRNSSRDYAVAERALSFDLSSDPNDGAERALKDKILSEMKPHSIVWGWHVDRDGEHQHIAQLSKHGLIAVGGANEAPNFSFHSRVNIEGGTKRFKEYNQGINIDEQIEDKIYLTFMMSDGDSLNHLLRNAHGGQWLSNDRGAMPFNWEMQSKLVGLGPAVLDYFQSTATENDYFIASASGVGYTFPGAMSESVLQSHLRESKPYLKETGLKSLVVLNSYDRVSDAKQKIYYENLGDELTGIIQGYVRAPKTEELYGVNSGSGDSIGGYMSWLSTSLPINHSDPINKLKENLNSLAERRPQRPLFVPIHIPRSYFQYSELVQLMNQLDGGTFEALDGASFNAKFAKIRSNNTKIVINPPEFIVPVKEELTSGKEDTLNPVVQNFGDQPTTVNLKIRVTSDALSNAVTSNMKVQLESKETKEVQLKYDIPAGLGGRKGQLEYIVDDEETPRVSVPVTFTSVQAASQTYQAEEAHHDSGHVVDDSDASNGKAWQATAGEDDGDFGNHMVWYTSQDQTQDGDYKARFWMKVSDNTVNKVVGQIDMVQNIPYGAPGGPTSPKTGNTRKFKATDFDETDTYQAFELPFSLPVIDTSVPPAQDQYRVAFIGDVDLTVDRIELITE